jgi:hypothetical protein
MKNLMKFYFSLAIATLLLMSCGQISKEVAKDSLNGQYKGQATYVYKYSQLNIGIDDTQKSEDVFAMVFTGGKSPSLVVTSIADMVAMNIDITGFKLLTNGASFNIIEQVIHDKKTPIHIQGNPIITDTDGNKSDGFIDDREKLTFAYSGTLPLTELGIEYNLPFEAYYELRKLPKEK